MKSLPEVTVAFRIHGTGINPEAVTQTLGLTPDHVYHRGDGRPPDPTRIYEKGMWLLRSKLPRTELLESHLDSVLLALEPKQTYILALSEQATVDFYCTLYELGACELSAGVLGRIAALGATLGIDVYPEVTLRDYISTVLHKLRSLWFNLQHKTKLSI